MISVLNHENNNYDSVFISLIAVATVYILPCKITVLENKIRRVMIGNHLLGDEYSDVLHEEAIYRTSGSARNGVAANIAKHYMKKSLDDIFVEIINDGLFYFPQIYDYSQELFNINFEENLYDVIEKANKRSDFILINTEKSNNSTSYQIFDMAEKIIVMIKGEYDSFSNFSVKFKSLVDKCIFVIFSPGYNNNEDIKKALSNIHVRRESIFFIPFTTTFKHYLETGNITDYIRKYINCSRYSSEFRLINELRLLIETVFGNELSNIRFQFQELMNQLRKQNFGKNKYSDNIDEIYDK